jgi:hypothetical protein
MLISECRRKLKSKKKGGKDCIFGKFSEERIPPCMLLRVILLFVGSAYSDMILLLLILENAHLWCIFIIPVILGCKFSMVLIFSKRTE